MLKFACIKLCYIFLNPNYFMKNNPKMIVSINLFLHCCYIVFGSFLNLFSVRVKFDKVEVKKMFTIKKQFKKNLILLYYAKFVVKRKKETKRLKKDPKTIKKGTN